MFSAAPPGEGHVVAGCVWGGCANRNILTGQVEFINKIDSSKKTERSHQLGQSQIRNQTRAPE
jgi:hypothetical protein